MQSQPETADSMVRVERGAHRKGESTRLSSSLLLLLVVVSPPAPRCRCNPRAAQRARAATLRSFAPRASDPPRRFESRRPPSPPVPAPHSACPPSCSLVSPFFPFSLISLRVSVSGGRSGEGGREKRKRENKQRKATSLRRWLQSVAETTVAQREKIERIHPNSRSPTHTRPSIIDHE